MGTPWRVGEPLESAGVSLPTAPPPPPQPPAPPPPQPRAGLLRRFRVEIIAGLFVLAFLAALLVPTWTFGGFEQQRKPGLPKIQVGTTVEYGEFRIKPIGARLLDHHPTSEFDDEKNTAFLVLQVTVENMTKGPAYSFDRLLLLQQPVFTKGTPPDRVGLVSDNNSVSVLQPRVPETVQAIWPIPDARAAKIGDTLNVTLQRQEFSEGYFSQRYEWRIPRPWLTIVTPVVREEPKP